MARPKNKDELLEQASENFKSLKNLINTMDSEKQNAKFKFEDRDQNLRDVLIHLHEWHNMFLNWYRLGSQGEKPPMPREGYSWKTTSEMNYMIRDMYRDTDLATSRELLEESHEKILQIINSHTNSELYTRQYYKWTGTTSLGSYLVSATSSHYDWAIKKVKKHIKQ